MEHTNGKYWFDEGAAELAVAFIETYCKHSKGEWAGQLFLLEDWQKKIVRDIFGWKKQDGLRRYSEAYIEIPKKNGKSTFCAALALLLLLADNEPGAEVYSAAADKNQARIVFNEAKNMVLQSKVLHSRARPYRNSIAYLKTASRYEVLSADVKTKHGFNAHGIIFDELHAQPNRDLWDTLTGNVGARRQPLTIAITTAGFDRESICWIRHEYARQVQEGIIDDDSLYVVIYAADPEEDWTDREVWKRVNPNYGISCKVDYLEREFRKAKEDIGYQNTFRRLHLNQWVSQESRWMDADDWAACDATVDAEALAGRQCYAGLDLSATTDLTAFALVFPPVGDEEPFWVLPFFWLPGDNIGKIERRDNVPYSGWAREGYIRATGGNVIDSREIIGRIIELGEKYRILEIAFDRWGSQPIVSELTDAGFAMWKFGQGFTSMSSPTKDVMKLVLKKQIAHGGHPVLRWNVDNANLQEEAGAMNEPRVKITKSTKTGRIDGAIAMIMAFDRAFRNEAAPFVSVYETRGLVAIGAKVEDDKKKKGEE